MTNLIEMHRINNFKIITHIQYVEDFRNVELCLIAFQYVA